MTAITINKVITGTVSMQVSIQVRIQVNVAALVPATTQCVQVYVIDFGNTDMVYGEDTAMLGGERG